MLSITRNSFLKSLLVSTAVPQLSFGSNPELEETAPTSHAKGITAAEAASLMKEYRVVPITGKHGTFDFFIGNERYNYGFLSAVNYNGIKFATKERHRIIVKYQSTGEKTPEAIRVGGEWQLVKGSTLPWDFPIYDLNAVVERLG